MKNFNLRANIGMRILKLLPNQVIESMPTDIIEHYKFNVDNLLQEFEQKNEITKETLKSELIKFASRNDKHNLGKCRTIDIPALLEVYKKGHERSVDEYLAKLQSNTKEK
jgi:hypothetical protein